MKTPLKRAMVLASSAALVAGLGACSGGGGDDAASADDLDAKMVGAMEDFGVGDTFKATEPVTFDVLYRDHPNYPNNPDWLFYSELANRTNVSLEPTLAPLSDWEQRRSLLIGAGDAPSIISVTAPGAEVPFVSSGAILPVSDYLDLMPNFQDKVEKWGLEDQLDTLRQEDGKFYLLPGLLEELRPDYTLAFRTDVLEQVGVEPPTSWDEVRTALEAIKAAHPDSYPLSDRWEGQALLNYAAASFGTAGGWGYGLGTTWDEDAEEFVYTGATDEYRDMVTYFHGLVEDGLMDPESFTQPDDTARQKLANQQSYAVSTNAQELLLERTALDATVGQGAYSLAKIEVPEGPAGDVIGGTRLESGLMVSSSALERDDFVAMMQFIDWLYYSDEGLEYTKWGVEGTTYTQEGEDYVLTPDVTFQSLNPAGTKNLQKDFGFFNGVYMLAQGSSQDLVLSHLNEEEVAWQEAMAEKEQAPVAPPAPLDEIELEQAGLTQSALNDTTQQATLQFILGQRDPEADWDAYVQELEGAGMGTYLDLVNGAHDRYEENS